LLLPLFLDFRSLALKAALEEGVLGVSRRKGNFFLTFVVAVEDGTLGDSFDFLWLLDFRAIKCVLESIPRHQR
jgi:hypothetical protein